MCQATCVKHLELVKVSVSLLLAVQGDSRQVQSEITQQFTDVHCDEGLRERD